MPDREIIIPETMRPIVERAGYAPAVRVGDTLYCAGQVGRTPDMEVIPDPEQQFIAAWENLRAVLSAGGCKNPQLGRSDSGTDQHGRRSQGNARIASNRKSADAGGAESAVNRQWRPPRLSGAAPPHT